MEKERPDRISGLAREEAVDFCRFHAPLASADLAALLGAISKEINMEIVFFAELNAMLKEAEESQPPLRQPQL